MRRQLAEMEDDLQRILGTREDPSSAHFFRSNNPDSRAPAGAG
jgi:hypothetical protein